MEILMITRAFLAEFKFSVMDEFTIMGFGGCESPVPLYAESEKFVVVIDGDKCEVFCAETMELLDSHYNIRSL
jgi:hypothetical protein